MTLLVVLFVDSVDFTFEIFVFDYDLDFIYISL